MFSSLWHKEDTLTPQVTNARNLAGSRLSVGVPLMGDENQNNNLRIQSAINRYNASTLSPKSTPRNNSPLSSKYTPGRKCMSEEKLPPCKKDRDMYEGVGNFPIIRLKKTPMLRKPLKRKVRSWDINVNIPELPVNRLLSPSTSDNEPKMTRSVLDVLQDLSRKRINLKDDDEVVKRNGKGLGGDLPLDVEAPYKPLFVPKRLKVDKKPTIDKTTQTWESTQSNTTLLSNSKPAYQEPALCAEDERRNEIRRKLAKKINGITASFSSSISNSFSAFKRKRDRVQNDFVKEKRKRNEVTGSSKDVDTITTNRTNEDVRSEINTDMKKKIIEKSPKTEKFKDPLMEIYLSMKESNVPKREYLTSNNLTIDKSADNSLIDKCDNGLNTTPNNVDKENKNEEIFTVTTAPTVEVGDINTSASITTSPTVDLSQIRSINKEFTIKHTGQPTKDNEKTTISFSSPSNMTQNALNKSKSPVNSIVEPNFSFGKTLPGTTSLSSNSTPNTSFGATLPATVSYDSTLNSLGVTSPGKQVTTASSPPSFTFGTSSPIMTAAISNSKPNFGFGTNLSSASVITAPSDLATLSASNVNSKTTSFSLPSTSLATNTLNLTVKSTLGSNFGGVTSSNNANPVSGQETEQNKNNAPPPPYPAGTNEVLGQGNNFLFSSSSNLQPLPAGVSGQNQSFGGQQNQPSFAFGQTATTLNTGSYNGSDQSRSQNVQSKSNFGATVVQQQDSNKPAINNAATNMVSIGQDTSKPMFSFGSSTAPSTQPPVTQNEANKPMFSFGSSTAASTQPPVTQNEANKPMFSFGSSTAASTQPPVTQNEANKPMFSFGSSTAASTQPPVSQNEATKPMFSFGSSTAASAQLPVTQNEANKPMFSFGANTAASTQPSVTQNEANKPMFAFGASTAASTQPAVTQNEANKPVFAFGANIAASTQPPVTQNEANKPMFAFGASSATSTQPPVTHNEANKPMFSFGGSSTILSPSTAAKPSFSSLFPSTNADKPAFNFGANMSENVSNSGNWSGFKSSSNEPNKFPSQNFMSNNNVPVPTQNNAFNFGQTQSNNIQIKPVTTSASSPFSFTQQQQQTNPSMFPAVASTTPGSMFPAAASTTPGSMFPAAASTTPGSMFIAAASTTPGSMFPAAASTTPGSMFPAVASTTPGSMFPAAASTTPGAMFPSAASATPAAMFPSPASATPAAMFPSPAGSLFPSAAGTTPGTLFPSVSSTTPGSMFSSATSTAPAPMFPSASSSTQGSMFAFAANPTPAAPQQSIFPSATSKTPNFGFGSNATPEKPVFQFGSQQTSSASVFSFGNNNTGSLSTTPSSAFKFGDSNSTGSGSSVFSFGSNQQQQVPGQNMFIPGNVTPSTPSFGMFSMGTGSTQAKAKSSSSRFRRIRS